MVKARIKSVNWSNSLDPTCLVVLKGSQKVVRVLRMRVKDLPSKLLTRC
jgi:hypothetical protein